MKINNTKGIYLLMAAIILAVGVSATAIAAQSATGKRASNIKSKGNFDFENGKVTIYSSDLIYLADEIDLLEDTYKTETVKALEQIGTYFNPDGTSTHGKGDSNISSSEAKVLPYGAIIDGILHSQSIPTERTYTGTIPGQITETHGSISAAAESNLSLGTAAWVEGKLIVGTGGDNFAYYTQGSQNGYNKGYVQGSKDGHDSGYSQGYEDGVSASKIHMVQITDGDIKSLLPDVYQLLTVDNFFIRLESISGYCASDGMGQKSTYYGINCRLSYDAASGQLTVDGEFSGSNVLQDGNHTAGYNGYKVKDFMYGGEGGSGSVRGETNVIFSLWCVY